MPCKHDTLDPVAFFLRHDLPVGVDVLPFLITIEEKPADKCETRSTVVPNDSSIMVRESDNAILINGILANVESYDIIVPDKVMKVHFVDGGDEKVVVRHGDTFDLDTGIRIAVAKHVGRDYYNMRGIENLAHRLSYLKCIDKMLSKARKQHKRDEEAAAKKAEENRARSAKAAREKAKKAAKASVRRVNDSAVNRANVERHLNIKKCPHGKDGKGKK